eukprot:scaffold1221_cov207-Amphora_coffeaeformis.AAC.17
MVKNVSHVVTHIIQIIITPSATTQTLDFLDVSQLMNAPIIMSLEHGPTNMTNTSSSSSSPSSSSSSSSSSHHGHISSHKPPKRNLTAYNYFFRDERQRLQTQVNDEDHHYRLRHHHDHDTAHGKINFQGMVRTVAFHWRTVSDRTRDYYQDLAAQDKERYTKEMRHFYQHHQASSSPNKRRQQQQRLDEVSDAFTQRAVLDLPDCLESIFDDLEPTTTTTTPALVGCSALDEFQAMVSDESSEDDETASSTTSTSNSVENYFHDMPSPPTAPTPRRRSMKTTKRHVTQKVHQTPLLPRTNPNREVSSIESSTSTTVMIKAPHGKDRMEQVFGTMPLTLLGDIPDDAGWPF